HSGGVPSSPSSSGQPAVIIAEARANLWRVHAHRSLNLMRSSRIAQQQDAGLVCRNLDHEIVETIVVEVRVDRPNRSGGGSLPSWAFAQGVEGDDQVVVCADDQIGDSARVHVSGPQPDDRGWGATVGAQRSPAQLAHEFEAAGEFAAVVAEGGR